MIHPEWSKKDLPDGFTQAIDRMLEAEPHDGIIDAQYMEYLLKLPLTPAIIFSPRNLMVELVQREIEHRKQLALYKQSAETDAKLLRYIRNAEQAHGTCMDKKGDT